MSEPIPKEISNPQPPNDQDDIPTVGPATIEPEETSDGQHVTS